MESTLKRWKRRKAALTQLNQIDSRRNSTYLIHYSCESFYNIKDGRTPRVTSIAIRNLETSQTKSFSIHKSAEEKGITNSQISDNYDDLEQHMLDDYFNYVRSKENCTFIHWNMRNINYGFQAIEHRYKTLGGTPHLIDDCRKFDLSGCLIELYSVKYMNHKPHGRLFNLLEYNKISMKDICTGEEEAIAFENRDFIKLHQSTLKKVDAMANVLERINDGSLKTKSNWIDKYGLHFKAILELIKEHWLISLIGLLGTIIAFFKFVLQLF